MPIAMASCGAIHRLILGERSTKMSVLAYFNYEVIEWPVEILFSQQI